MLQVIVNVSLEKFQLQQREAWAMQKLFIKNSIGKNGQLAEILKTMGT